MSDIFPPPQFVKHFPASRHAALSMVVVNLLTTTLAPPIQNPFHQNDWPNPVQIVQRQQPQIPPNRLPLPTVNTKPFKLDDWPNPRLTVRGSPPDIFPNLNSSTLADTGSVARGLILSSRLAAQPRPPTPQWTPPNNISRLSVANTKPFKQDIWPNPVFSRPNIQADIAPNLQGTTLAVTGTTDYLTQGLILSINVAARQIARTQDSVPPNLLTSTLNPTNIPIGGTLGISQAERRVYYQAPFDFPNITGMLSAPNPLPYNQSDWPNPILQTYRAPVDNIPNITIQNPPPPPPPVVVVPQGDPWRPPQHPRKKKKAQDAPWERQPEQVRTSLMAVVEANAQRKRNAEEQQDEEDLMALLERYKIL